MRVDRRVSPNQTALWTVYELVSAQAVHAAPPQRPAVQGLGRLLATAAAHAAVRLRSLVGRLVVTSGDWVESRRGTVVSRRYAGRRIA
jgi:hypothetical protein